MRTFKDSAGHEWSLAVNVSSAKRVRDLVTVDGDGKPCRVDLIDATAGDPPLAAKLHADVYLLVNVIYVLCKPEADAIGVTDEQFGERLGGHEYDAYLAFVEEWEGFFRNLHRDDQARVVNRVGDLVKKAVELSTAKIDVAAEDAAEAAAAEMARTIGGRGVGATSTS